MSTTSPSTSTAASQLPSIQDTTQAPDFSTLHISSPDDVEMELTETEGPYSEYSDENEILPSTLTDPHRLSHSRPLSPMEEEYLCLYPDAEERELFVDDSVAANGAHEALLRHREALRLRLSHLNSVMPPALKIPWEILAEIAQLTIPPVQERNSLDVRSGIWVLSQVCSSWRTAILNTPLLWSNIKITNSHPKHASCILLESIQRSQCVALDVTFSSEETELSKTLLQHLCSHSSRWRSLDLCIHTSHWSCLLPIRHALDQLRFLYLDAVRPLVSLDHTMANDIFAFAPKLSTAKVGRRGPPPPVCLRLPEKPLICELYITGSMQPYLSSIIPRLAVNLQLAAQDWLQLNVSLTPSNCPLMKTLWLTRTWLLDALTCERLNQLVLSGITLNSGVVSLLQRFIERSFGTQKRKFSVFRVYPTRISARFLVPQLYQTVSFITILQIFRKSAAKTSDDEKDRKESRTMTRLIEPLLLTENRSDDLLPHLSALVICFRGFNPTPSLYRLIHNVVESRANPPVGYKGTKLSNFHYVDTSSGCLGECLTLDTYNELTFRAEATMAE